MPGGLRTARHCVFTGGVVEENSICRADFLRKQPRGGKNPLRLTAFASSPEGELYCADRKMTKSSPFGGAARERLRGFALSLFEGAGAA